MKTHRDSLQKIGANSKLLGHDFGGNEKVCGGERLEAGIAEKVAHVHEIHEQYGRC